MAPLVEALATVRPASGGTSDHRKAYEGTFDPTWNIGIVPCGGTGSIAMSLPLYAIIELITQAHITGYAPSALILQACIQYQATSGHIDPLHISAHYLRQTNSSIPFKVYVHTLKTGKGFSNLVAELYQEDTLRITAHAIFGVNAPSPSDQLNLTLLPPSPYARRYPLHMHPSECKANARQGSLWTFGNHISWSYDSAILAKNQPDHPSRQAPRPGSGGERIGGDGLEWGSYLQFDTPTEKLSNAYIPFLADMFLNTIILLPTDSDRGGLPNGQSWFPTMTLAVEFKYPISMLDPAKHSMRTVGLYAQGRFVNHPQGRHDVYCEVWTAPANLGEVRGGGVKEGWREDQVCLAQGKQMALTVPVGWNMKNGREKEIAEKSRL
ncbi:hypothetical protein NMY22_g6239 [Coprinellus aureogranulatus]|nr:hypothetical protein NMY22_g6239 [Coprinellus aureogranulatus]